MNWGTNVSPEILAHREEVFECAADAVGGALARSGMGARGIARRLGRQCQNAVTDAVRGQNVTLALLADIALATGHELVIELRPARMEKAA